MVFVGYKEVGSMDSEESVFNHLSKTPLPDKAAVVEYLMDESKTRTTVFKYATDVFTDELLMIAPRVMNDGDYWWSNMLGYYVDKYNLELPDDFLDFIRHRISVKKAA